MLLNRKIAILLPDLRGGGAERVAVNLANEFINRGYSVDLVLLKAVGAYMPEVNQQVKIIDLHAQRIRSAILPLVKYIKNTRPDAMIANMWPLTGIALIAKMLVPATRCIVTEHTNQKAAMHRYSRLHNYLMLQGMRWLFPRADAVVSVSKGSAYDLSKLCAMPREKILTIYNPIVGEFESPSISHYHLPAWWLGSHKRLIAVGSLKDEKNYPLLLRAFSILVNNMDAKLLILGEGDGRFPLELQIKQLGLTDSVLLPGFASNPLVFLRHADLFVLSSDCEGFGNVVVEALQAGTPVVSTDCPSGPREILEDGRYGILVPVGDSEELAAAMLESLNSTHDKEALKARAQDFTITKAADQYLALLFPDEQANSHD